jgi:F0F1-type ATP synthase membrane subunit c/vacuolar-type H+-ATPase subunit K
LFEFGVRKFGNQLARPVALFGGVNIVYNSTTPGMIRVGGSVMKNYIGAGVGIGVCAGAALTAVLNNPVWVVIGVVFGVVFGLVMNRRNRDSNRPTTVFWTVGSYGLNGRPY